MILSNECLDVLMRAPLLLWGNVLDDKHDLNYRYYLADGIYLRWSTFVKPIAKHQGKKELIFHNAQAEARKYAERAFGIFQSQFVIAWGPSRFWDKKTLWHIMTACVLMHNMIIENEHGHGLGHNFYQLMGISFMPMRREERIKRFMKVHNEIEDSDAHDQLQKYYGQRGA